MNKRTRIRVLTASDYRETFRRNAGLDDTSWVVFVRTYSIVLALILAVTAFLSVGYYHPDEHFQTIEFASYKLGKTAASDLAWEFRSQMRPWLQPACYVVIIKTAALLGVIDPFILALIFRLFSAFFAWLSISAMMFCAYRMFHEQSQRKAVVRLLALFCFLPYYMVRTSSESLSSSFCMMGLALLILGSRSVPKQDASFYERAYPGALCFVTGILWGLAFEFRYQVAFLIMGFLFWMFFVSIRDKKTGFGKIMLIVCGILVPVAGCTFLDSWGYGRFTIAPWNYLDQNIFQHKAAGFGTMPVWGYFLLIVKRPLFPALLTLGAAVGMWRFKKHPFIWGILAFFLIHSFIGHKEIRFLLNLTVPALFMVVYAAAPKKLEGGNDAFFTKLWKLRGSLPAKFVYALNLFLLILYSTKNEQPALYLDRYIYRHTAAPFQVYAVGEYPYPKVGGLQTIFYQPEGIEITERASLDEVLRDAEGKREFFLTASNADTVSLPAYGPYQVEMLYRHEQKDLWTVIERVLENEPKVAWTLYRFVR